jgi:hypothetical protein
MSVRTVKLKTEYLVEVVERIMVAAVACMPLH